MIIVKNIRAGYCRCERKFANADFVETDSTPYESKGSVSKIGSFKNMYNGNRAGFYGHFPVRDRNAFEMTEKMKSFRAECLKINRTVAAGFNTTVRQMTKCLSEKKNSNRRLYSIVNCLVRSRLCARDGFNKLL